MSRMGWDSPTAMTGWTRWGRSRSRITGAAVVAVLTVLPSSAGAQLIQPGMRIRVTQTDGYRRVGEVVTIRPDSALVLAAAGGSVFAVPRAKIVGVEYPARTTRRFWDHFAQVVAIGAVSGGLVATVGTLFGGGDQSVAVMRGAAVGAIVAVPLGIIAGSSKVTEHWEPMSHPVMSPYD